MMFSCKKDKPIPPTITKTDISEISYTTAVSGGDLVDEGSATFTSRGVCWNTISQPTIENYKTNEGFGLGIFTSTLTGLSPNSTYYVRAYASNSAGTGYGNQVVFNTLQVQVPAVTTSEPSIAQVTAISGGNIRINSGISVVI